MNSPVDQEVRTRALDPAQSFIVQAPAGSGKTELLTRRVLTLLCTVNEPEEILAITFTKKAASEMRQRVVETLQHALLNPDSNDSYELEGIKLAQAVLARDAQLGWQLIRNPQRLNLRTIDSLATQLAHRLPVTSTLGAPTALVENADLLCKEAARRFIESNLESLDLVLLHLGNKLDNAQNLLARLLAKRDQWKRHVYNAGHDHNQLRAVLEGMLAELIESRLENLCSLVPPGLPESLMPRLAMAAALALVQAEGDVSELPEDMQLWHDLQDFPGSDISDLDVWASVAFALLTSSHTLRKRLTKKEGFAAKTDAKKLGVDASELVQHKQRMLEVLGDLEQSPEFIDALVEVRKLPQPFYKDEQWALLSQLLSVLPHLLVELQLVFAERAQIDFGEISARAALALGTEDTPTDLALSMDLSLTHLLVDEFQDTSQTQFRLFQQLLSGWTAGDGRSFFAVGDPMQSIYRFREADVALFTQVQEQGIGSVQVTPLTLSVNFRAAPALTQWVNDTFSAIFPKHADVDTGAVPFAFSEAFRTDEGNVQVHPLIDSDSEAEARCVASLCAEAIVDDPKHQVAILVRSRAQAAQIFVALRENELAYESVDMDLIGERAVVRDLVTLVMAIRYPHDRLHWLSLLRAPFVGLTLHDLHALMDTAEPNVAVIERLRQSAVVDGLTADGQQRVKRLLGIIEPALKHALRRRLMPWIEAIWLQLGGPVVCENDLDQDAAKRAIELLFKLESRDELWQKSAIEDAMAGLYAASPESENCQIQIMTLHKSKGLEFDTVILPALDRQARADGSQLLNWFESTLDGAPRLLLAPFEQVGLHPNQRDRLNKLVRRAEERCAEQEKLRLLYVACTRAKRHLHIVARVSHNSKGELASPKKVSLLSALWPLLGPDFLVAASSHKAQVDDRQLPMDELSPTQGQLDLAAGVSATDQQGETPGVLAPTLKQLPLDIMHPTFNVFQWPADKPKSEEQESKRIEYLWAGREARNIGTVIHDQLQYLAQSGAQNESMPPDADPLIIRRQLRNEGVNAARLDAAGEKVMKALANTLDDKRGRWILKAHEQARSEWALTVPVDNEQPQGSVGLASVKRIVIDRTFVDENGTRWIIDYKSGDHEGGDREAFLDKEQERYTDQLNHYADIIRRMETRPIRVGLYFPMLQGWREWEHVPV